MIKTHSKNPIIEPLLEMYLRLCDYDLEICHFITNEALIITIIRKEFIKS